MFPMGNMVFKRPRLAVVRSEEVHMFEQAIKRVLEALALQVTQGATLQQRLFYVMEEIRGEERANDVRVLCTGCPDPERVLTIQALTILRDQMSTEWKRQQQAVGQASA